MKTKLRQKTANIKKCVAQMCHGKMRRAHFWIKDSYMNERPHKANCNEVRPKKATKKK